MSIEQLLQPFLSLLEWTRTFEIRVTNEISFTFMEFWIYVLLTSIVLYYIAKWLD